MASPSIVPTVSPFGELSALALIKKNVRQHKVTHAQKYPQNLRLTRNIWKCSKSFFAPRPAGDVKPLYYMKMEFPENQSDETQESVSAHYDTRLPKLSWSRRMQIPIIAALVYSVIRTLGPTLRFEVLGQKPIEDLWAAKQPCIWAFWHRVILPIAWYGRNRGIVVMNTTAFDGQWTRKVIEWLGFGTAQGSSSRGGLRGLQVMAKRISEGIDCAFTIDGPRGPRYVAKVGPVLLARMTGAPIVVFHVGVNRGTTVEKTWDRFLLPHLFANAVLIGAPPIHVPMDADSEVIKAKHEEMQKALEHVRDLAEGWFSLSEEERDRHRVEIGP
jgi:hypothetical protein